MEITSFILGRVCGYRIIDDCGHVGELHECKTS